MGKIYSSAIASAAAMAFSFVGPKSIALKTAPGHFALHSLVPPLGRKPAALGFAAMPPTAVDFSSCLAQIPRFTRIVHVKKSAPQGADF